MSLEYLRSAFGNINTCEAWSIQLLRIKTSRNKATEYATIAIHLTPERKLEEFVQEISERYIAGNKCQLTSCQRVQNYDGTAEGDVIYKLDAQDVLIAEEYQELVRSLASVEQEADPLEQKWQAYAIEGEIKIDDEEIGIKLISMQNPITTLKHKFLHERNAFKEIETQVLSLRPAVDVIILGNTVYFMTMAGEKLFHMERSYRKVCENKIAMLEQSKILYDSDCFRRVATTGHHPRMFVTFNEKRCELLKDERQRKRYAEMFGIPLKKGAFDTSTVEAADKLVRLICKKGMIDPFEDVPVEVSGARKWEK